MQLRREKRTARKILALNMTVKVNSKNLKTLLVKYQSEFKGTNYKERKKILETFVNELLTDFLNSEYDDDDDGSRSANEIEHIPPEDADLYMNYN